MTFAEYHNELAQIRQVATERRAEAWASIPDRVLGLPLRPVTPATLALLLGTRNAFVCGGEPREGDVKDWLLFHSPSFNPDQPAPRFWSRFRHALRVERALCPLLAPRARREIARAASLLQAAAQITVIVRATFADALPGTGEDEGPAVAASMTAQLADIFARDYNFWPLPQSIRHTPLAQLFQLARCRDRAALGEEARYFDRDEFALTARYLKEINAERLAQDAKREAAA